jgi:hypothetical protein
MSDNFIKETEKKNSEKKELEKKEPTYQVKRPRVKWSETEIQDLKAACLKVVFNKLIYF